MGLLRCGAFLGPLTDGGNGSANVRAAKPSRSVQRPTRVSGDTREVGTGRVFKGTYFQITRTRASTHRAVWYGWAPAPRRMGYWGRPGAGIRSLTVRVSPISGDGEHMLADSSYRPRAAAAAAKAAAAVETTGNTPISEPIRSRIEAARRVACAPPRSRLARRHQSP